MQGQTPAKVEEKDDWPEQTTYSWLNRFEERGFEIALRDEPRSGRRPLLSPSQRRTAAGLYGSTDRTYHYKADPGEKHQ